MRSGGSAATERFFTSSFSRVKVKPFDPEIEPEDRIFFGGSCFAESLFNFWRSRFLPSSLAPFGSIYNPLSLRECFTVLAEGRKIGEDEISLQNGLWTHPLFNSSLSLPDREEYLETLNLGIHKGCGDLQNSSRLVLTLGTAFVYEENKSGRVVSNCHRRPASDFKRRPLGVEECARALENLANTARRQNPGLKIIISLSPVRHLRDDATENSLSKAVLRCAINEFLKTAEGAVYFPSYEILLDELRDYRWFADDLAHPSPAAVAYIMERFCEAAASSGLSVYLKEAEKIDSLLNHRLRFPDSPEGEKFILKRNRTLKEFQERFPWTTLPARAGDRK